MNGLHARGLDVCAWQFIYGDKPGKEAKVGAAAVANGADCLVLDVEGQYEGKYPQASYFMSSLRSLIGPDYPLGLASFPYVDYHPALPYSVFLGPGGAQYNIPQLYWKDIGTTVDTGYIHTWVWNRIYGRPDRPARAGLQPPEGRARSSGSARWPCRTASTASAGGTGRRPASVSGRRSASRSRPPPPGRIRAIRSCTSGPRATSWPGPSSCSRAAATAVPVSGYFQTSTQTAVYAFQRDHGLPQTGNLDVPTWEPLLQNKPLAVRWVSGGGAVAAKASGRVALPPPKSAKLPAVRDEIPPPSARDGR